MIFTIYVAIDNDMVVVIPRIRIDVIPHLFQCRSPGLHSWITVPSVALERIAPVFGNIAVECFVAGK